MSSDLISGGASGGIVAIFILGANWARSFLKPNGSRNEEAKAREMGGVVADLAHVKAAVDELKRVATENQSRVGELAGNVDMLTKLITNHFKP
jgi:hypothetical protein